MLSLREPGWSRRDFLRIGSLSLGGLSLAHLAAARAADADSLLTGKSVVFLFMHGGPPQTETFDPKMGAPSGIRSVTGEIRTSLPGVTYGSTFPQLAKLAHKTAVVRSFVTGDGNHNIKPLVCPETFGANPGSIFARVAGSNHPVSGIPTNVAVFPRAVMPDAQAANHSFGNFLSPGRFGAAFTPFEPGGNGQLQKDMTLSIPRERLGDRQALLDQLDDYQRAIDAGGGPTDPFREQAFGVLRAGVSKAFELSGESPRLLERYDTGGLIREDYVSSKWKNRKNYLDHIRSLGRQMLLARRGGPALRGRAIRPRGVGLHRRRREPRLGRQDPARRLRGDGPLAPGEPRRGPRPLGQPGAAFPVRRRAQDGAGGRRFDPGRRRT